MVRDWHDFNRCPAIVTSLQFVGVIHCDKPYLNKKFLVLNDSAVRGLLQPPSPKKDPYVSMGFIITLKSQWVHGALFLGLKSSQSDQIQRCRCLVSNISLPYQFRTQENSRKLHVIHSQRAVYGWKAKIRRVVPSSEEEKFHLLTVKSNTTVVTANAYGPKRTLQRIYQQTGVCVSNIINFSSTRSK